MMSSGCRARLPVILSVLVWLGLASVGLQADSVSVATDGKPDAVIVHNGHDKRPPEIPESPSGTPSEAIRPAYAHLQTYLEKITGAKLPVVSSLKEAGDRPAIVLEVVDADRLPEASDTDTGAQAYRLKTDGNRLIIRGAGLLAIQNAVFGLLEDHLGVGFYSYRYSAHGHGVKKYEGPGHEVIPEDSDLTIGRIDDFQEPSFATRGLIFTMGGYPWIMKNRGVGYGKNTSAAISANHNLYSHIPPDQLFDKHPEIYALNANGERKPDDWNKSICGTADALPKLLARSFLKQEPRRIGPYKFVTAGQGDGFAPCHCTSCRRLVHKHQSEAAPYIHAFNEALEIVEKEKPDLQLLTFMYFGTLRPPKEMEVHENLWLNVVSSSVSANPAGDQMGPIRNNPANADYADALRKWPKLAGGRVTVWHWDTTGSIPRPQGAPGNT